MTSFSVQLLCWLACFHSLSLCQNGETQSLPHPKHSPQETLEPPEAALPSNGDNSDQLQAVGEGQPVVTVDGPNGLNSVGGSSPDPVVVAEEPIASPDPVIKVDPPKEVPAVAEVDPVVSTEEPQVELIPEPPTETTEEPDEVIPSFKEFREQKEKEENEKEKGKTQVSRQKSENESDEEIEDEPEKPKPKGKLIQKNYADIVCGAKIVDNKKDFKNCPSVLNKDKDSYAMIPCEGSFWFVVELCDAIQIQAIQLANYELFASSIHEFKVYMAEAYPTKEWTHVGTFAAVNKREIEKFDISGVSQYSKYVKFEKISHKGKEHFCVLSTFQVLGMSMVDEYEEQQAQPETIDPYELPLDSLLEVADPGSGDKSLIVGAKNAVKNIVDSALGVLGVTNKEEVQENVEEKVATPTEPIPEEKVPVPEAVPDPVVVKVDERGKEIKGEAEEQEAPDKQLKGEEGQGIIAPPATEIKKTPVIMEGVDLTEEQEEQEKGKAGEAVLPAPTPKEPAQMPATKPVEVSPKPVEVQEKSETAPELPKEAPKEAVKEEPVKVEQKAEMKPVEQPAPAVEVKDSKGVVMTSSPKKNSIFLELDKRIKELERNLSLSNDYLETLSNRYKRVDNLFKPLEKTLATVDEAMGMFEERLKRLEARFERFQATLADVQERVADISGKSNSLITSTNLILFILLLSFYFIWRMSKKVNEISLYCEERGASRLLRPGSPAEEGENRRNHRKGSGAVKQQQVRSKSRDTSPVGGIRGTRSLTQINKRVSDAKNPLESLHMDLIYPQPKASSTSNVKSRRPKHVR